MYVCGMYIINITNLQQKKAMENLLSWINTVLVSMQAQSAVFKALAQQNSQIEAVLSTYVLLPLYLFFLILIYIYK